MPASTPQWSTPSTVAPWPGRRPTLGLAAAIVASVLSGAAMADPLPHDPLVVAGMQLRAPGVFRAPYAVYSATYGIERGTCDRRLVARDIASQRAMTQRGASPAQNPVQPVAAGSPLTYQGALLRDSPVGRGMDAVDLGCVGRILEYAPDRLTVRWYGADHAGLDGPAYALTPLATFERDGLYCRDYRTVATRDGRDEQNYGTACRRPDGVWQKSG